jgi:hypothetical protein
MGRTLLFGELNALDLNKRWRALTQGFVSIPLIHTQFVGLLERISVAIILQ